MNPGACTRRSFVALACALPLRGQSPKTFDVRDFGAAGDGKTLDTAAFQKAIDAAAAAGPGARVLVPGGRKYLVSTLVLKSAIDFHLADDAELRVSTNPADYPAGADGVLTANGASGLKITGAGNIDGRALEFMTGYNQEGEIWRFGPFRPKIFVLTACQGLEIRGIGFSNARCNSYVKRLPYANAAYNYHFQPGESGKLILEFWITPFDYAGCEGPRRAVETVLTENKLIGLAWAVLDYDDAHSESHAFWNLSRRHTMYGKADELVAFASCPSSPNSASSMPTGPSR